MSDTKFHGFPRPTSNYFRLPNDWTDWTCEMKTWAEHKIVEYLLRHTWGYQEYGVRRKITLDEFMNGRKRSDGSRIDKGTGLGKKAVIDGIRAAVDQGFIFEEVDGSDRARVKKYYSLVMRAPTADELDQLVEPILEQGFEVRTPDVRSSNPSGSETEQQQFGERTSIRERQQRKTLEEQQHGGVVEQLTEIGMTEGVARRLAEIHDAPYIEGQLDWVLWLRETSPRAVGKNLAGYARRAIEEHYQPPMGYQTPAERQAAAEVKARKQAETDAIIRAEEERRARQLEHEQQRRARVLAVYRREHPAAVIPGTKHTTETAWHDALQRLQNGMIAANYQTYLSQTFLAECDGATALVVAPSGFVADWLRQRFNFMIRKQLTDVLGFDVQLDFLALSDLDKDNGSQARLQ